MAIHSICLVRDEVDIIEHTLRHAATWSNHIYVHDNGSTDGTWELVLRLARELPQVVPYRRDAVPFDDALRREAFGHFAGSAATGDWWCRLDADEVYIDDPRRFLDRIAPCFDTVWSASFQYYLTDLDIERYREDPSRYGDDIPIEQRCRFYVNNWSEVRFFRRHRALRWERGPLPAPLRRSYPQRIRLKHYQYRSPQRAEKRFAVRAAAMQRNVFTHELRTDWASSILAPPDQRGGGGGWAPRRWTERVLPAASLMADDGERYEIEEAMLPPIRDLNPTPLHRARAALSRGRPTAPAARRIDGFVHRSLAGNAPPATS
ncbi:MAG: glycosyltransferase family 2 protein [Acidimicrobiales bacterium]|nr:glycosyltransferase family 2 protein [Acidimicrobiales bacterium]